MTDKVIFLHMFPDSIKADWKPSSAFVQEMQGIHYVPEYANIKDICDSCGHPMSMHEPGIDGACLCGCSTHVARIGCIPSEK